MLAIGLLLMVLGLFAWAAQLVYQVVLWLKDGIWTPFSVVDLVLAVFGREHNPWFAYPHDWVGLYAVLDFFAPGAFVAALGLLALLGGMFEPDR